MRRIRKISVGADYKDCYCVVVGQRAIDGNEVYAIMENNEDPKLPKYDVYIKKGNILQFWKDFYKKNVIGTEDFLVD